MACDTCNAVRLDVLVVHDGDESNAARVLSATAECAISFAGANGFSGSATSKSAVKSHARAKNVAAGKMPGEMENSRRMQI